MKRPNSNNVLNPVLICSIFILLTGIFGIYGLVGIYQNGLFISIILVGTSILNILILWLRKNNERGLINGLLWLLLSNLFILLVTHELFKYGGIPLRGISYLSIYCHFLKGIKKKIVINRTEADSLKASLIEEYNQKMEKQLSNMQLKQESIIVSNQYDTMTTAYNKKAILEVLNSLLSLVKKPMSVLMIDIDNFKQINDTYGHIVGDNCIKNVVDIMQNSVRKADYIGRYGGDEFLVVLPNTSSDEAKSIAEKLRTKIIQQSDYNITISVGIACYPEDGNKTTELIEKADKGLYASKRKGKNSVCYIK
ncbi:GGDEF domain-containing protein [Serpentinicella alkaliphila]|uniref:GGDEF domain-containing protein n=1 Tax=Serpentinicella alkaliphila TaxID=1734049 RepID=UPI0014043FB0|nr:GGDEF domain-containing protein [Serpentinicella alkaliphila]QUH24690.1 GGDEF domain-containing protein [Serpentinicella alkaliphila]